METKPMASNESVAAELRRKQKVWRESHFSGIMTDAENRERQLIFDRCADELEPLIAQLEAPATTSTPERICECGHTLAAHPAKEHCYSMCSIHGCKCTPYGYQDRVQAAAVPAPAQCKCYEYVPNSKTRYADLMTGGDGKGWTVTENCPIHRKRAPQPDLVLEELRKLVEEAYEKWARTSLSQPATSSQARATPNPNQAGDSIECVQARQNQELSLAAFLAATDSVPPSRT